MGARRGRTDLVVAGNHAIGHVVCASDDTGTTDGLGLGVIATTNKPWITLRIGEYCIVVVGAWKLGRAIADVLSRAVDGRVGGKCADSPAEVAPA